MRNLTTLIIFVVISVMATPAFAHHNENHSGGNRNGNGHPGGQVEPDNNGHGPTDRDEEDPNRDQPQEGGHDMNNGSGNDPNCYDDNNGKGIPGHCKNQDDDQPANSDPTPPTEDEGEEEGDETPAQVIPINPSSPVQPGQIIPGIGTVNEDGTAIIVESGVTLAHVCNAGLCGERVDETPFDEDGNLVGRYWTFSGLNIESPTAFSYIIDGESVDAKVHNMPNGMTVYVAYGLPIEAEIVGLDLNSLFDYGPCSPSVSITQATGTAGSYHIIKLPGQWPSEWVEFGRSQGFEEDFIFGALLEAVQNTDYFGTLWVLSQ